MLTEEDLVVLSGMEELTGRAVLKYAPDSSPDGDKLNFLIKNLPAGVYNIVRDKFYSQAYRSNFLGKLKEKDVVCITRFSDGYPENLKNIYDPPAVLYCKGNTKLLKTNCFSVVGSRRTQPSVLALTKKICGELTQAFTVVTGIADGADSAAVEGALPSGKIISVLANGFDRIYPATNRQLFERIAHNGLVVTEYPPYVQAMRHNFLIRNRIIAGLSRATLVVSAGKKSGALNTANHALEYGRDVFAFPYNAGSEYGEGCNALIKNGAYLTENILDIFKEFGLDLKTQSAPALTEAEAAVYEQIKNLGEAFLPDIARNLNMFTYSLLPVITMLEIKGLIVRLGGNRFSAVT